MSRPIIESIDQLSASLPAGTAFSPTSSSSQQQKQQQQKTKRFSSFTASCPLKGSKCCVEADKLTDHLIHHHRASVYEVPLENGKAMVDFSSVFPLSDCNTRRIAVVLVFQDGSEMVWTVETRRRADGELQASAAIQVLRGPKLQVEDLALVGVSSPPPISLGNAAPFMFSSIRSMLPSPPSVSSSSSAASFSSVSSASASTTKPISPGEESCLFEDEDGSKSSRGSSVSSYEDFPSPKSIRASKRGGEGASNSNSSSSEGSNNNNNLLLFSPNSIKSPILSPNKNLRQPLCYKAAITVAEDRYRGCEDLVWKGCLSSCDSVCESHESKLSHGETLVLLHPSHLSAFRPTKYMSRKTGVEEPALEVSLTLHLEKVEF